MWRVLAIGVFALSLMLVGCGRPARTPGRRGERQLKRPQTARVEVKGGTVNLADPRNPSRIWQATAGEIRGDFPSGAGTLLGVQARLLDAGKATITVTAKEARYLPAEQTVVLRGGVRAAWRTKAATLQTERLRWSLEKQTLDASGDVRVTIKGNSVQGDRLHADAGLKRVRVTGEETEQ